MVGKRFRQQDDPRQQIQEMGRLFPGFRYNVTRNRGLVWRGLLSPTLESPEYRIRIRHERGCSPRVFVDDPPLALEGLQHIYREEGSLCLFWPEEWRWKPRESLATTIVPWAILWLYFYECWLVTGEWLGPSSPHGQEPKRIPR